MGNEKWTDKFPTAEAMFVNEGIFYHTPGVHEGVTSNKTPFKYFHMWSMVEEFKAKV